jgi:glycosyltransferase involved in cell wall biosynthesis
MTLISVIIPTFNRRHTLPRAIDSVLGQTHRDLELIVVDDVSTDDTIEYLRGIDDPRLKILRLDTNGGAGRARNEGLKIARGTLIAYQDSDDEWSVRFLEQLLIGLERAGPDTGVIYCGKLVYGRDQQRVFGPGRVAYMPDPDRTIVQGDIYRAVLARPLVSSQTFLVRRELMAQVGGWHETIRKGEDWELSARLARITRYAFIEEPLCVTYLGADSATHNELKGVGTMAAILDAHADTYAAHPALHASLLLQIARTYQRSGKFAEAAPFIRRAAALRTARLRMAKIMLAQALKLGPVFRKRAPAGAAFGQTGAG